MGLAFRQETDDGSATAREGEGLDRGRGSPRARRLRIVGGASAVDLDRRMLAISGRAARCRFVQGRLAAQLLARRGWRALGFVRLSDYSRERLGIGARAVEDVARVAAALEQLPRMTAAFLDGALSWTAVRLVASVASAQDEAQWIQKGRTLDTRALEKFVRGMECESSDQPADTSDEDSDDPSVRWSVRVSRMGRTLWRAAGELAERSAGCTLTAARLLELVAAEAASGAPAPCSGDRPLSESSAKLLQRLRGSTPGGPHTAASADCDVDPPASGGGNGAASAGCGMDATTSCDSDDGATTGRGAGETTKQDSATPECAGDAATEGPGSGVDSAPTNRTAFDWRHGLQARDPQLAAFLADIEGEAAPARPEAADPFALDARLREVRLVQQRVDRELASLLREAVDGRLYHDLGFKSLEAYVEERLGICPRTAWSLLAIERATSRRSPLLAEAWADGRVSSLAARTLLPVVGRGHDQAWIVRAQEVTLRRLEAEVAWAAARLDDGHSAEPPPVDFDLTNAPFAGLTFEELQMRARSETQLASLPCAQITFLAPQSVIALAEETMMALRVGSESRGSAFERMLALAIVEWMAAPSHRDPVFERDGWRCAVPCCSSRRNLHDHHVVFRSRGGDNARNNRITVCAAHHLHGLHDGRIRAHGSAPHGIVWELGVRFGGDEPLAHLHGDRYLDSYRR